MLIKRTTKSFFVPRFGHDLADVPNNIPIQLKIFPPYKQTDKGLDLDTSGLLIADSLVLDTHAAEFINEPSHKHLAPMRETIQSLKDEGKIQLRDFSEIQRSFEPAVRKWVDKQIARPERWADVLRRRYKTQLLDVEEQIEAFSGGIDRDLERLPFGIICALSKTGNVRSIREQDRLMKLFFSQRSNFSLEERMLLIEVVRPYVAQAATDLLISQKLDMPFMSWDTDNELYELLSVPDLRDRDSNYFGKDELDACRYLLNHIIPELRPVSIEEIIDFSRDRIARKTLIAALRQAVTSGEGISSSTIANIQQELILAGFKEKQRGRVLNLVIGILGLPANLLPIVGSILFSVFGMATTELANRSQTHRWYSKLLVQSDRRQENKDA